MNPIIINLSLAVFWLFLGAAILAAEFMQGKFAYRPLGISLGWWALLLSAFNWFRVWMTWSSMQARRERAEAAEAELRSVQRQLRPEQPPDPNFKFTDQPPPAPEPGTPEPR